MRQACAGIFAAVPQKLFTEEGHRLNSPLPLRFYLMIPVTTARAIRAMMAISEPMKMGA
jgi:hypothetical protein